MKGLIRIDLRQVTRVRRSQKETITNNVLSARKKIGREVSSY